MFRCPKCGEVIERDMRKKLCRMMMTKRGYRGYCSTKGKKVLLIPMIEVTARLLKPLK